MGFKSVGEQTQISLHYMRLADLGLHACTGIYIQLDHVLFNRDFINEKASETSFMDLLCFCSVLCLLCLCVRLFICALWSPAGKELTSWLSFVVSTVSLSLSHWFPGSGVVLDCIDS